MRVLIGIDDTDNLDGPGTGHRVRQLAAELQAAGIAQPEGITRHQLLVSPEIPYTSHNSSACLTVLVDPDRLEHIARFCADFLTRESAPGSDAGLCVASWESASPEMLAFGAQAKVEVLTQAQARRVAALAGLLLEGYTGTGGGVIGALAAVGLRAAGDDGRFLWLPGLRELHGVYTVAQLSQQAHIGEVQNLAGVPVLSAQRVAVGEWVRPVLRNGKAVLLVEEIKHDNYEWGVIAKEHIKQLSA